ncbi:MULTISPECIES: hypothetical protein [Halomicrobium]|uniref:Ribbon-helix-helix protein CopG domain-containing protein n=2 Tax=Halomicrobium mukohataei TaxID=57705 RepID=C7P423_HALMD|nr:MULTISPECIES: hypothetical protein [Halomicrobium]ACV47845.1 hypothetical protein Hmuk_1731 [Halomicrobium mukohataei DSM 12286]QCD66287.1 hypothetical protein E5139_11775 [Halomicrobium mukohataei]QFR21093.1 hypothetical protein GBQ70_11770 [Halomicrobium sp. ZPS1]
MSGSRGSRLPGDSETADRHKAEARAEARFSGALAARFDEYIEAHGATKSDVVRDALDEFLPSSQDSRYLLPEDPTLADAYLALAGDQKRVISVERVKSILCEETHPNTPKQIIREEVLEPLDDTPFLSVVYGKVAVRPLTARDEFGIEGGAPADD